MKQLYPEMDPFNEYDTYLENRGISDTGLHQLPGELFVPHLFARENSEVVHHLYRVAAGLDSLVLGEPQVLGQVKEAFSIASEKQCSGPFLNRLFHSAFAVGKRVRTETELGAGAVSVSFAAVQLARKIFGSLKDRRVLVMGAGEMGKLDIGQGCVVCNGLVLAVEAQEGTDEMLKRVFRLPSEIRGDENARAGVLVKRPKPIQENRIDLPTIGPSTVRLASEAGLSAVCGVANGALWVEHAETARLAEALGVALVSLTEEGKLP